MSVNSAIRLPVSYNISTFGGVSQDYTSFEAWEADTDNDLVAAGAGEVLKVTDDQSVYEWTTQASTFFQGAVTNVDYFRAIIYHESNTSRSYIHWTEDYHIFLKEKHFGWHVDVVADGLTSGAFLTIQQIAGGSKITNCRIKSFMHGVGVNLNDGEDPAYIVNCTIHDCIYSGVNIQNYSILHAYNNTIVNNGGAGLANWSGGNGTIYSKNNIVQGNSPNYGGTVNATNDATSGVQFVDEASEDYRLAANDTVARNQGIDLRSDAVFAFGDDIRGIARPRGTAWDIGAYEGNAAPDAPTSPSPTNGRMIEYATSVTLSCTVDDADKDALDVSFYDASDDSLIDTDTGVLPGGTASVTWNSIQPGFHSWYVKISDGIDTTTGPTWTFTLATQMQSHLMQDTTTLAVCWYIKRTDGVEYGYTTADKTLTIDGLDYKPVNSGEPSSVKMSANLSPDNSEVEVVLDDDDIPEEELRAGLFDYAQVKKFLVNYENVSLGKIKLISGRMGKITILDGRAKTEFMSLTDHLNMQIGRHILPTCDAELGDSRCGVDLASYTVSGTITSVTDNQTFTDSDRAEDDDYFTYGKITFTSGDNNGLSMDIKDFASGQFKLMEPMPYDVAAGDTYEAVAGCNKEFSTCKDKFNNGVNFRGFPHLPGPMEILRYET